MRTSSKDIFSQWFTHWHTKQWYFCKFNGFPLILLLLFLVLKMIFVTLTMFPEKNCQKEMTGSKRNKDSKKLLTRNLQVGVRVETRALTHMWFIHLIFYFLLFYQFCIVTIFHVRAC
jgi:hypothetical protein